MVSIARNQAIDRLRSRGRRCATSSDMFDLADPGPTPEASASGADDRRRIEACLEALPPDRAKAVQAAYVEGWSYEELARRFDGAAQHHADLAAPGAHRAQGLPGAMSDVPLTPQSCPRTLMARLRRSMCCGCSGRRKPPPAPSARHASRRSRGALRRGARIFEALDGAFAAVVPPARLERRTSRRACSGRPRVARAARLWRSAGLWRGSRGGSGDRRGRLRLPRAAGAADAGVPRRAGARRDGRAGGRRRAARRPARPRGRPPALHPPRRNDPAPGPVARALDPAGGRKRCRPRSASSPPSRASPCRSPQASRPSWPGHG